MVPSAWTARGCRPCQPKSGIMPPADSRALRKKSAPASSSDSGPLMSMRQPVSLNASRAFCPSLPIASDIWSVGTITVATLWSPSSPSATLDFRNFLLEQAAYQSRIRPADNQLWATRMTVDFRQQNLDSLVRSISFCGNLLTSRHDGFGLAELNDHGTAISPLDHTVEDLTFLVLIFPVDILSLEIADSRVHNLFHCLGGNSPEVFRSALYFYDIARLGAGNMLLCFFHSHLRVGILHSGNDSLDDHDLHLT